MEKVTGQIKVLGTARVYPRGTKYSYIEIGDKRFKNVIVTDGIEGILKSNFKEDVNSPVWIYKGIANSYVCAVTRGDGTVFKMKWSDYVSIFAIFYFTFIAMVISIWMLSEGAGTMTAIIATAIWLVFAYFSHFKFRFAVLALKADDTV